MQADDNSTFNCVPNANSKEYRVIDSYGSSKREYVSQIRELLSMLERSHRDVLQNEAQRISCCGRMEAIIYLQERSIVQRKPCGSCICPICGARPVLDDLRQLSLGIAEYREADVPIFFASIRLPGYREVDAVDLAWEYGACLISRLRSFMTLDWHMRIEIDSEAGIVRSHVHMLLAVLDDCPQPKGRLRDLLSRSSKRYRGTEMERNFSQGIKATGINVLEEKFPELKTVFQDEKTAGQFVHLEPVDDLPASPDRIAWYVNKTLRCGMTIEKLLDTPVDVIERLVLTSKPPEEKRARRMKQSAAGSRFSRQQDKSRTVRRTQRRVRDEKSREERRRRLYEEIGDFLGDRMPSDQAERWAGHKGRILELALRNDQDSRADDLYWKLYYMSLLKMFPAPR